MTWLDARDQDKAPRVNEKAQGGQYLPGKFDGDETDGGAVRACPSRLSGAPAVERKALGGLSGSCLLYTSPSPRD